MEEKCIKTEVPFEMTVRSSSLEYEMIEQKIFQFESARIKECDNKKTMKIFGFLISIGSGVFVWINLESAWVYLGVVLLLFSLLFLAVSFSKEKINELERQIDAEKKKLSRLSGDGKGTQSKTEYFDSLVKININNLEAYYTLVKNSNSKSFWVSICVASIGIIFITLGLFMGYVYKNEYRDIAYISSAAGVFIEIVTALLFYLYNKTVIQLKEYHSSLLDVQNVLLSFKLIGDVNDEKVKIDLMKEMLSFLVKHK